ncbi:MAG: hypothetical protein WD875_12915 [Pirellulales bacterium]
MADDERTRRWGVMAIAVALIASGVLLAVGAYQGGPDGTPDFRRGLIVAAAVLAFLSVWGLALGRSRRG